MARECAKSSFDRLLPLTSEGSMNRPVLRLRYLPKLGIRNSLFPMALLGMNGEILRTGSVTGVLVSFDAARGGLAGVTEGAGEVMILAVGAMVVTNGDQVDLEEPINKGLPAETKTCCGNIAVRSYAKTKMNKMTH